LIGPTGPQGITGPTGISLIGPTGPQGITGPTGISLIGPTGPQGITGQGDVFIYRGEWNPKNYIYLDEADENAYANGTWPMYKKNDVVSYNGNSFVAVQNIQMYYPQYGHYYWYFPYTGSYETYNGYLITDQDLAIPGEGWNLSDVHAKYDKTYGNIVIIENKENKIHTAYAHLQNIMVHEGEVIRSGQVIGKVGNSGSKAVDPMLHFVVRHNKTPVDPINYLNLQEIE
jgi:murein DD-endopeptidase MepM/ murein hydrolase activator NlpD